MSDGPGVVGSRAGVPPRFCQPPLEVLRASVQSAMRFRRPLAHRPSAARQICLGLRPLSPTSLAMHASYPRLFTDACRNRSSPKFVRKCSRKLVHEEGPGRECPGSQKPAQLSRDRTDDVVAGLLAAAASLSAHPAVLVVGGVPLALLPA
jgi:hypothetical protein